MPFRLTVDLHCTVVNVFFLNFSAQSDAFLDIVCVCRPSVVFEGGIVTGLGFVSPATGTWLIKGGGIVELVPLTRALDDL